jgi:hypothetical protein
VSNCQALFIIQACLISLLTTIEGRLGVGQASQIGTMDNAASTAVLGDKDMWILLVDLIQESDMILSARLTLTNDADNNGAVHLYRLIHYLGRASTNRKPEVPGRDQEQALITEHQQKGQVLFESRFLGYQAARRIGARMFPVPPSHCCCSNLTSVEATFKDMYLGVESSIKQHILSSLAVDTFSATL